MFENYIGGRWVASRSGQTVPDINPADRDEVLCRAQESLPDDAVDAMEAAGAAYPAWRATPVPVRAALLLEVVRAIRDREEVFVRTITLENGKTLRESGGEFASALKGGGVPGR